MTPSLAYGRDTSLMLPPAGMGDMPSFCPGEGRVVPPTGFRPVDISHAEKRMAGLNSVGGGRANGLSPAPLDDRANDLIEHIADAPPRAVGAVEVVFCVREVGQLHAPSIRMENENDVQVEPQKSSSDVLHHC